ncbi:acidic mammalian chitinase-like [Centruroides sculpturatus]|uniref:acidic mammalian chitinase-like n=1 Tax=Centruroides sculpturatus TaxID=218467 RepID=UPI000C6E9D3D|nr:acidic mammalian chitinase-like [Centruroides sculpturatus]
MNFLLLFLFLFCCLLYSCETVNEDVKHIRRRSKIMSKAKFDGILHGDHNYTLPFFNEMLNTQPKKIACYYVWNHMKNGTLMPNDIDPHICTHILLGFSSVFNSTLVPPLPEDVKGYEMVIALKKKNPNLKLMLSAGGGKGFSEASYSAENRTKFINSIFELLNEYGFDGFDIDWEFPAWDGLPAMDRINFILLLKEFRLADKQDKYLLSVAVAAPKTIIDVSYDIPNMAKYVDFVNLMAYDYHDYSWYMPFTGHNSPLFKRSVEKAYFSTLNTAWSAQYWVEKGLPKSKLLVGIPTYSHSYKLAVPYMHGFDAPAVGSGLGELSYSQVCDFLNDGAIRVFDGESEVPYAYKNLDWVGYDDVQSVVMKAMWIKKMGLGGAMTFDLNNDDWKGTCDNRTKFILHQTLKNILIN